MSTVSAPKPLGWGFTSGGDLPIPVSLLTSQGHSLPLVGPCLLPLESSGPSDPEFCSPQTPKPAYVVARTEGVGGRHWPTVCEKPRIGSKWLSGQAIQGLEGTERSRREQELGGWWDGEKSRVISALLSLGFPAALLQDVIYAHRKPQVKCEVGPSQRPGPVLFCKQGTKAGEGDATRQGGGSRAEMGTRSPGSLAPLPPSYPSRWRPRAE